MKITKRTVEALRPDPEKQSYLYDEELPGFGVRVSPGGTKSYFVQYRNPNRRTRRLTLGRHGVLPAELARTMAREALVEVVQGGDPAEAKKRAKDQPTVKELGERYMTEHAEPKKSKRAAEEDRRMLDTYITPKMGARQVADVGRSDVARRHHEMRDKPVQANRVLALLNRMFNHAERWGLRPDGSNPCQHVEKYKEEKKERYLSSTELRRIGQALRRLEEETDREDGKKPVHPQAILALRLLLLTGARRGEILSLRWEYLDLQRGELRLPTSKTGQKSITLSKAAQDLLRRAPRDSEWVIPSPATDCHWKELRKPWKRVKEKVAGLQDEEIDKGELAPDDKVDISDVRIHDLRHSFASVAAGQGIGLQLVGKLLGHTQTSTTERYAHLADDPVHQAADRVGAEIAAVLDDEEGGEVVGLQD